MAEVHYVGARRSFVIVFEPLAELWELSTDPQAAPIFDGLVHDYHQGEAIASPASSACPTRGSSSRCER